MIRGQRHLALPSTLIDPRQFDRLRQTLPYVCRVRVFLTSDSMVAEGLVHEVLASLGHEIVGPASLGAGALLDLREAHVDAVIAVLWSPNYSRRWNAMHVEIGIALGREIPVLLVTKPKVVVPALQSLPKILVGEAKDSLLGVQVDLFLQGISRESSVTRSPRPLASGVIPPPAMLSLPGMPLEEAVRSVFVAAGQENARVSSGRDQRADFTLYFPPEEGDMGVVLVEVKQWNGRASKERLRESAAQLSKYVIAAGAGLGLLVYDGAAVRASLAPLVTAMTFDELRSRLADQPLAEVLRRARNEAIHGR